MFGAKTQSASEESSSVAASTPPPSPSPSVAASPYWRKSTEGTSSKPSKDGGGGFSPLIGFCFTINYILGTGFLTVPWAFAQGGLLLSAFVMVATGIFSDMSKNYLLETMARAEAMLDDRMHWIKREAGEEERKMLLYSPVVVASTRGSSSKEEVAEGGMAAAAPRDYGTSSAANNEAGEDCEEQSEGKQKGDMAHARSACELTGLTLPGTPGTPGTPNRTIRGRRTLIKRPPPRYLAKRRKFEVNSLCRVFLGKSGLRIYTALLCLYIYCTMWAYTCVFASAMAAAAPLFAGGDADVNYLIYALAFASMVVPMSCMEIHEQVGVQVTMTGARFLMLGLMLATSEMCAEEQRDEEYVAAPMVRLEGISKMAPIMVFAHIYHHSVPGLAHPVADKKALSGMFRSTAIFCTVAYSFIGLVLGARFGTNIDQSSNLNWKDFTGGTAEYDEDGRIVSVAWWATAVSYYVLCFPALDVVSAFPLNAITLGNNMMGSAYGKRIHEVEKNRWIRTQFRLLASVPPIIFGILVRQLGTITDYAGTTGLLIGFSFPALLYLRSRAAAARKHFSVSTFYSGYSSSVWAAWFLFYFGLAMVAYVVFFLIQGEVSDDER